MWTPVSDPADQSFGRLPPIKHALSGSNSQRSSGDDLALQPVRGTSSFSYSQSLVREENPFVVPGKEDVFVTRKMEKIKQQEERARQKLCSVAEKTTFSSRVTYPNVGLLLNGRQRGSAQDGASQLIHRSNKALARGDNSLDGDGTRVVSAPPDKGIAIFSRTEKESMVDFISKKREIFLVQMQLDTKREEMHKLEADTTNREDQVCNSEAMLEEDALRFDAFLKENDVKVQEAVKRADAETKAKIEKIQAIKRLNADIEAIQSELSKYEEQLEDCMRYKSFIDSLTPAEFFHERATQRELHRTRRTREWEADVQAVRKKKLDALERTKQAEQAYVHAQTQQAAERAEKEIKDSLVALKAADAMKEPPRPQADEEAEPEEDLPELFFTDPKQLLSKYKELESKNLFLIQNIQEIKEELEDQQSRAAMSTGDSGARISDLLLQENDLQQELVVERDRVSELKRRIGATGDVVDKEVDESIEADVYEGVRAVYTYIGFEDDHSAGVLTMLKNIENKVEEYLRIVNTMADDFVETAEKACEKERRKLQREEKIEEQRLERESRLKTAMERAKAPIHKKQGKPDMFRSQPLKKKEVITPQNDHDLEWEELQVLRRDIMC